MKSRLFIDFIRPRRRTQVDTKQSLNRPQMASDDEYLEEITENSEFDDTPDMDYSALASFTEFDSDATNLESPFENPTREEQAELANSGPNDFVSEPKSFAATILKISNREKNKKAPIATPVAQPVAPIVPTHRTPVVIEDYDQTESSPQQFSSTDGFIHPSKSARALHRRSEPRVTSQVREPEIDESEDLYHAASAQPDSLSIPAVRPLTPADQVPLEFKTKEELLELAERQAAAMQNTREARAARAKREADLAAARAIELEQKRIEAEAAELERIKLSRQQKYPPRPNFINTNVNKRPLSRSNGPAAPVPPRLPEPVYLSSANPAPHPLPKNRPQFKKSRFAGDDTPKTPKFIDPTEENNSFSRSNSSRSATVIVPSAGSRKTPNLTIFIFAAIIAGAIVGAATYLLFLSK